MKSQKWYDAIKAANSKPRSAEHRAKLSAARKGKPSNFSDPAERKRKIAETRQARIEQGGCTSCGSFKHTAQEHAERLAQGRRKSSKWKHAVAAANTRTKKGQPKKFRDPAARSVKLKAALNRPETRQALRASKREMWANRSDEERQSIAEKSSQAQKGRRFTPEHLANLRAANSKPRTAEHKRKLSENTKGREVWNTGLTKETHASLRSNSEKQMGRVPDYNKYRAHYDGPKGLLLMRSRWEVAYAEYLDKQGTDWQYEPRWFRIGDGEYIGHTYTPDFYLPATDEYIEIKGRMTQENANKIQAFRNAYPDLKLTILSSAELMALGLLDKHRRLI